MKNYLSFMCIVLLSSCAFGQTTWYEIPTGTDSKLNAIDFPSSNVGYLVGEDTTLLKSTDGGQTWQELPLTGISITGLDDNFTDIDFVDENVGFLVAGYSGIYSTVDGGQTWSLLTGQTSNMCFPHCVYPFSQTDFFAGGAGCFEGAIIDHYENGSWTQGNIALQFWDSQQGVLEMSFSNPSLGLAATRSEYMLRTVDGGVTWDTISTGIADVLTSVFMVNDTLCYAGYKDPGAQGFGVLKSEDGGLTWAEDFNSATFFYPNYLSVHVSDNGDVYSGGSPSFGTGGLIFELASGATWDYQTVDQPINDLTSYGSDITFGVGDSGYLIVNTPLSELSVFSQEELKVAVFPNPFQDKISIDNPTGRYIESRLIDVNGRVIRVEELQPGLNECNLEDLNKGMYFIEVKSDQTKTLERIVKQ